MRASCVCALRVLPMMTCVCVCAFAAGAGRINGQVDWWTDRDLISWLLHRQALLPLRSCTLLWRTSPTAQWTTYSADSWFKALLSVSEDVNVEMQLGALVRLQPCCVRGCVLTLRVRR